jgi:glycosyltransferase involved in cell wall biosynthesis
MDEALNDAARRAPAARTPRGKSPAVLMLGWELPPRITGGLGVACAGLIDAIAADGHVDLTVVMPSAEEVRVPAGVRTLSPANEHLAQVDATRVRPHASVVASSYTTMIDDAWAYAELARYVMREAAPFDVIHAHDWLTFKLGQALQQRSRKPLIAHVHSIEHDRAPGMESREILAFEAEGLRAADCIVAVSDYSKRRIVDAYGIDASRIRVVHNGLASLDDEAGDDDGDAPTAADPRDVVSFAGRITAQKNPQTFVHAARAVLATRPATRFVMAGDGDLRPAMEALVETLGMTDRFEFPGFLPAPAVRKLLRESAVFAMPSQSEPFGLVAGEAIQCGAPVVLSKNSGILELLSDAVVGIEPTDSHALARQITHLLESPEAAAEQVRRTSSLTRRQPWGRAAAELTDLYDALAARPARRAASLQ